MVGNVLAMGGEIMAGTEGRCFISCWLMEAQQAAIPSQMWVSTGYQEEAIH